MEEGFENIKQAVEKELACSAHNMDHVNRVYNLCLRLAEEEDVDLDVLKAAALLHDVARIREDSDNSGNTDHAVLGAEMAEHILQDVGFPQEKIQHVKNCIVSHRYRTGNEPRTKEAQILFDADKLDVLGAVGIARAFMWVGRYNAKMYKNVDDVEEYAKENLSGSVTGRIQDKTKHSPQIEFITKWKHIIDRLHTEKAKKVFRERIGYSEEFLDRLEKEVNGEL